MDHYFITIVVFNCTEFNWCNQIIDCGLYFWKGPLWEPGPTLIRVGHLRKIWGCPSEGWAPEENLELPQWGLDPWGESGSTPVKVRPLTRAWLHPLRSGHLDQILLWWPLQLDLMRSWLCERHTCALMTTQMEMQMALFQVLFKKKWDIFVRCTLSCWIVVDLPIARVGH